MSFYASLSQFGQNTALIDSDGEAISYETLQKKCEIFNQSIKEERSLILIAAKNSSETVVAYLSALMHGHVAILVNADTPTELLEPLIQAYQPNYIWKPSQNGYALTPLHTGTLDMHPDLALLIPTSGTTGSEKMIRLSYQNLQANTASIVEYLPLTCKDRAITTLPLYYSFGLSILHTHLALGACIVLSSETLMSKTFWQRCERHHISSFSGVPYHFEMLRRLGFDTLPNSLRYITQAGGKMNEKLVRELGLWCQEHAKALYIMYGQSEATARMSYLDPTKVLKKPKSIGKAIPGGSLEIINGELRYRGANVMLGYAKSLADLGKEDTCKGVLYTGDLGYRDDEGDFYITGRSKRFIKLNGLRIGLDEIEQFLKDRGIEAMCSGDDKKLVVGTCKDTEVQKLITKQFGLHHSTIAVITLSELLIKPSGKYDYHALMEHYHDA